MKKSIKILAIGNSSSVDGMEYLWHVLSNSGYDEIILGNLAIASCTVEMHADNVRSNAPLYQYGKNVSGSWMWELDKPFTYGFLDEEWDIITLQQASGFSGIADTYNRKNEIVDFISTHKRNPDAKILWHMTWAYDNDSPHNHFEFYGKNQHDMYRAIISAVKKEIISDSAFFGVIPSGVAIQNLRENTSIALTRDSFHLSESHGRYTAALTWACAICDVDLNCVDWMPIQYKTEISAYIDSIKKSVTDAMNFEF